MEEVTEPKKPRKVANGARNRFAGHQLERDIVLILHECGFPHASTARAESKSRDDSKIDIMNKDEEVNGRLPYNIQAKNCSTGVVYPKLLSIMPKGKEYNVIIHNQTVQSTGGRFITKGQFAIMNSKNFFAMVAEIEKLKAAFKLYNDRFDCIPAEDQAELHNELTKLGL